MNKPEQHLNGKETLGINDEQPKLSRAEQRERDRRNLEATEAYNSLTNKFLNFFIENENPEESSILEKQKELSAKWRVYCKRKDLMPSAYPMVDDYCKGVIAEYQEAKREVPGAVVATGVADQEGAE